MIKKNLAKIMIWPPSGKDNEVCPKNVFVPKSGKDNEVSLLK